MDEIIKALDKAASVVDPILGKIYNVLVGLPFFSWRWTYVVGAILMGIGFVVSTLIIGISSIVGAILSFDLNIFGIIVAAITIAGVTIMMKYVKGREDLSLPGPSKITAAIYFIFVAEQFVSAAQTAVSGVSVYALTSALIYAVLTPVLVYLTAFSCRYVTDVVVNGAFGYSPSTPASKAEDVAPTVEE